MKIHLLTQERASAFSYDTVSLRTWATPLQAHKIPIKDRAMQAVWHAALVPIAEEKADPPPAITLAILGDVQ